MKEQTFVVLDNERLARGVHRLYLKVKGREESCAGKVGESGKAGEPGKVGESEGFDEPCKVGGLGEFGKTGDLGELGELGKPCEFGEAGKLDEPDMFVPGQFANFSIPNRFLRRPLSICNWEGDRLTFILKVVGYGTRFLANLTPGSKIKGLIPLGNGFDLADIPDKPVIIGGGVGVPPLYGLCLKLLSLGKRPSVILGFNSRADVFYYDEFRSLGINVRLSTMDGSLGEKGLVTDILAADISISADGAHPFYVLCCGPEPMLRAVHKLTDRGQFSLEARMGCGFGACMGCSMENKKGFQRVCKEGPVFAWEELKW